MAYYIFYIAPVVIIAWLIAEFKAKKVIIRIILGSAAIATIAYAATSVVSVIPYYERHLHRSCMGKIEEYLDKKDIPIVEKAILNYNKVVKETDNSYKAAMKMWDILSKDDAEK